MFTVNGSVKTIGPDNWMPIDTLYDFKRYACKFLLHLDENNDQLNNNTYNIIDKSPYNNLVNTNDITIKDISNESFVTEHYFGPLVFSFNGKSSYIISNSNNIITLNKSLFTISLWINTQYYSLQNSHTRTIFTIGDDHDSLMIAFEDSSNNASYYPSVIIYNNNWTNKTGIYNSSIDCTDGRWHHLLVTRDSVNDIRFFIDGIFIDKLNNAVNYGWDRTTANVYLGCYIDKTSGFYSGLIDECYILNGISEKLTDNNFTTEVPKIPYLVPHTSEKIYSGMTFHARVGQNVNKYDLLYYEYKKRSYFLADPFDESKLPVRGLALEDGKTGDTIEILAYGTIASNVNEFPGEENEYTSLLPVYSDPSTTLNTDAYSVFSTSGTAENLFNNNKIQQKYTWNNSYWLSGDTTKNSLSWIRIKLYSPQYIKKYSISEPGGWNGPKGWKLKGSNDKEHWVLLDLQNNVSYPTDTIEFNTINPDKTPYQYYEFYDILPDAKIGELHFYDENNRDIIPRILMGNGFDYIEVSTISAINDVSGAESYHLFDGDINTYWQPGGGLIIGDVLIDFGMWYEPGIFEVAKVDKIAITCNNDMASNKQIYVPFEFVFLGSDHNNTDLSTWDELYSYKITDASDSVWLDYNDRVVFDLNNDGKYYRYYKLSIKNSDIIQPTSCTSYDAPTEFRLAALELLDSLDNKINILGTSNKTKLYHQQQYHITDDSSIPADNPSYTIFDNITPNRNLGWFINSPFDPTTPVSVTLDLSKKEWVKQYTIWYEKTDPAVENTLNSNPKSWNFYGSNDNTTWTLIDTYTDIRTDLISDSTETIRTLPSSVNYQYYKFEILDNFDNTLGLHVYKITFKNALNELLNIPVFTSDIYIINEDYFTQSRSKLRIRSSENYDNNDHYSFNLVNDIFLFNICHETDYQWRTNDNSLQPWIIFDLPELKHTEYDHRINGYTIISFLDVNTHDIFRAPLSWIVRGFDESTHNWIQLDKKLNIHFRDYTNCFEEYGCGGVKLDFKLNKTYDTITKIQLEILASEGSTIKVASSFIGLKNFYPTYNNQIIEIPRFPNSDLSSTDNYKYLNYNYYGNDDFHIEVSTSSQENDSLKYLFEQDLNTYWSSADDIDDQQKILYNDDSHSLGAIEIDLLSSKRIVAYGIYYSLLSLCGMKFSVTRWTLKGSNDGINWDILDRVGLVTTDMVLKSYPMIFNIDTDKSYKFYKFDDLNGGCLHGIELYEYNTIQESKSLTLSLDNQGKLSSKDLIKNYNRRKINKYNVQNLGYTGLRFNTADEEYSVKYFDFNSQIEVINPNFGDLVITPDLSDPFYGGYGHLIENGPIVTLLCNSLQIQENAILTTKVPCRGLQIIVLHDCLLNGTIHMNNKGAAYSPKWTHDFPIYDHYGNLLDTVPRYGAIGGIFTPLDPILDVSTTWKQGAASANVYQAVRSGIKGNDGSTIINNDGSSRRATGGGGSGSAVCYLKTLYGKAGDGGRGSCFSGGAGGGGLYMNNVGNTNPNPYKKYTAIPAFHDATYSGSSFCSNNNRIYGANTSLGYTSSTASSTLFRANGAGPRLGSAIHGGGNNYNTMYPTTAPTLISNGAGGLVILIVYGNLYTSLTGKIQANGSQPEPSYMPACGGGSGGGSINIFVGGTHINNGIYEALGGNGGIAQSPFESDTEYVPGGAGGDGVVTVSRL